MVLGVLRDPAMTKAIDFMSRPAIDLHGHFGGYPGHSAHQNKFAAATAEEVSARAKDCGIVLTVVSNIGAFDASEDKPSDVEAANDEALRAVEQDDSLRFYAVLNPKLSQWEAKADELLGHPRCVGIKLRARWNFWDLDAYGDRVFGFLNERSTLVSAHTGQLGSEPQRFIPWANTYPDMKLILAHIGNDTVLDRLDSQIQAVCSSTRGNVWADTSSSNSISSKLIEYAVEQVGAERIVFGTDAPGYFTAMQKARIAYAEIPDSAKRKILYDNAAGLLGL